MHKAQIYIKKHYKIEKNYTELGGGVSPLNWGDQYPLGGRGCTNITGPILLSHHIAQS